MYKAFVFWRIHPLWFLPWVLTIRSYCWFGLNSAFYGQDLMNDVNQCIWEGSNLIFLYAICNGKYIHVNILFSVGTHLSFLYHLYTFLSCIYCPGTFLVKLGNFSIYAWKKLWLIKTWILFEVFHVAAVYLVLSKSF